jgi:hypothetical protein
MNKFFSFSWVWFCAFVFFWCIAAVSSTLLIQIKKTEFRNLWEKDNRHTFWWYSQERRMWNELFWKTPFWVKQDKNARIWIIVFRASMILGTLVWALPLFYALTGLFFS